MCTVNFRALSLQSAYFTMISECLTGVDIYISNELFEGLHVKAVLEFEQSGYESQTLYSLL